MIQYYDKFLVEKQWIDDELFKELFSISQALSGPASTKLLYCINLVHNGTLAAIITFFLFTLPVATAMFVLALGVSQISETLPSAIYAFLSGLNASVVGVIALAATRLSSKAIRDNVTRLVVFGTASAGVLYNALWYFPTLMAVSGLTTFVHDLEPAQRLSNTPPPAQTHPRLTANRDRNNIMFRAPLPVSAVDASFYPVPPLLLSLFSNMLLAGTIIFGGGPVVIPLLREYIVAEKWVSERDFLIGVALIQGCPGPNFNIAVFLGSLAARNAEYSPLAGGIIAWVGIFGPGVLLVHGTLGVWGIIRSKKAVEAVLRGVNAGAVDLIYTVIYRIWRLGFLDGNSGEARSLGDEPW
ncbi:chromate transporter-domain-containing protein [Echria macrotheca]|uniref:Chromate transporter-domain-containing protein n=1 Tax=Echria macrotheca TaxID=438768 RepID=A0AAJ0FD92_9PEZI|nr:chromate transporter-domain-containing protein [Echria macrotheca]